MAFLERRARGGPELVAKPDSQLLVDAERLGHVAAAGECVDQQAVGALAQRSRRDQGPGRPLRLCGTRCAQLEARGRDELERAQTKLLQLAASLVDPRAVVAREERLGRDLRRLASVGRRRVPARAVERPLGSHHRLAGRLDIDPGAGRQLQLQLTPALKDSFAERPPQLREHGGQRGVGVGRGRARPEKVEQFVASDRPVAVEQQIRDREATLAAWQSVLDPVA